MKGTVLDPDTHAEGCVFRADPTRPWECDCGVVMLRDHLADPAVPIRRPAPEAPHWVTEGAARLVGLGTAVILLSALAISAAAAALLAVGAWKLVLRLAGAL